MAVQTRLNAWQELMQTCVLGSARRQPALKAAGHVGALIDDIQNSGNTGAGGNAEAEANGASQEEKLLMALTATSIAMRCGQIGLRAESLPAPPSPCPEESLEQCPTYAITLLNHILADDTKGGDAKRERLLRDWLSCCRSANKTIVPECLPRLLDFAAPLTNLHQPLAACGGNHFSWLLTLNPEWQALYDDTAINRLAAEDLILKVQTGLEKERFDAFKALQRLYPQQARECLEQIWEKESYEQKSAFLMSLPNNIGMEYEDFFETVVLNDRRKEVRFLAAKRLSRLPQSRLVKRMQERAANFVKIGPNNALTIDLPAEFDKTMARDGIEESLTVDSRMGQKAGWLYQIVSLVNPEFWRDHTGYSAGAVLQLFLSSEEWSLPLLLGLLNSVSLYGNEIFQDCIIAQPQIHLTESQAGQQFLRSLPPTKLESLISGKLPTWARTDRRSAPRLDLWYYLELVDFQWSEAFSVALLRFIIKEIKEKVPVFGHTFYSNASNFGMRMHVGAGKYLDELNLGQEEIDTWTRNGLERFMDNLKLRCEIHNSFMQQTQTNSENQPQQDQTK